jgi:hypothetical protein
MSDSSRARIARNFIDRYGEEGLRELLSSLSEGLSGQVLAARFDVSRERVRQWKNSFGREVRLYQVHPDVQRLLAPIRDTDMDDDEPMFIELA